MLTYFERFSHTKLSAAHTADKITTNLSVEAERLFYENLLPVRGDWEALRSVLPDVEVVKEEPGGEVLLHVLAWPHDKRFCLLFNPTRPHLWRYVHEDDDATVLFDYDLSTRLVTVPAALSTGTSRPAAR